MQRREVTEAKRAVRDARAAWRKHRQVCRTCGEVRDNQMQYCADGWQTARRLVRAKKHLDSLTAPPELDPPALF